MVHTYIYIHMIRLPTVSYESDVPSAMDEEHFNHNGTNEHEDAGLFVTQLTMIMIPYPTHHHQHCRNKRPMMVTRFVS